MNALAWVLIYSVCSAYGCGEGPRYYPFTTQQQCRVVGEAEVKKEIPWHLGKWSTTFRCVQGNVYENGEKWSAWGYDPTPPDPVLH